MTDFDTGTTDLLARVEDGVGVLTMNRPERRNAFSGPMIKALASMLTQFETDDEVGAIVLTGASGAFCAGGDVKTIASADGGRERSIDERIHLLRLEQRATSGKLWDMPKPTIAALPGPAAGAGLALALSCDLRYAAAGTVLTTAFAKVGFAGDYGGAWQLTRLIGAGKAREFYFFSDKIPVEEAERLGIVNAVFAPEALEGEVMERARQLASGPRLAYRYMKENLNRAVHGTFGECLDLEATHQKHIGLTQDHREAVQAFVERREPVFHGR
jgi:2-(1,2-epoxy-1,2-dihydrophenyl)acetyl-CoA isomerase